MSENKLSKGESSSERGKDVCSSDGEDYYVFNGDFFSVKSHVSKPRMHLNMKNYTSRLLYMFDVRHRIHSYRRSIKRR